MSQTLRTPQQTERVKALVERFGIDGSKVLFFKDNPNEPWLRAKQLAQIARQSGKFKVVSAEFSQYIEPLRQIIYQGNLVDLNDHIYSLPGVATIGEKDEATGEEFDEHDLAEARCLRSTFELAGFDPFDPTSVVPLNGEQQQASSSRDPEAAETEVKLNDFARIHILAAEKRLIVGKDYSGYKKFLSTNYEGATSVAGFDPIKRKSVIAALERYQPPFDPASQPEEFTELEGVTV